ncbi:MAG: hypothetical protein VX693_08380 [Pseudomonadota bacterium]|nr:hypothetical protein [Pseudomonadota bacterium]
MPSAVDSIFDIAFWFTDRALNDNEYLQPSKLQYLLYLSQSYYAASYDGKKFFPAIFVAEEDGPIEPSLHRAWTRGRPNFDGITKLTDEISIFSDSIWRRFGHHSVEHLSKLCRRTPAYQSAYKRGVRAEIILEQMMEDITGAQDLPELKQVVKPKLVRSSSTGRAVEVKAWSPPILKKKNTSKN